MRSEKRKAITKKSILPLALMIIFALYLSGRPVNAASVDQDYLAAVRNVDSNFLDEKIITEERITEIGSSYGYTLLVEFCQSSTTLGYAVFVDELLVEFAEAPSPFTSLDVSNGELYYYDFSGYGTITRGDYETVKAEQEHNLQELSSVSMTPNLRLSSKTLTGVSPQLQGTANCIVCALSQVITYWRGHGFPAMAYGVSFTSLMNTIDSLFWLPNSVYPSNSAGYANNNVLSVAQFYGSNFGMSFSGGANWNPNVSTVYNEILLDYPCMVGFAAGNSDYPPLNPNNPAGHMTMCYGYSYTGLYLYMNLADGWSTNMVTKLWSSYNDCVITLHPFYFTVEKK